MKYLVGFVFFALLPFAANGAESEAGASSYKAASTTSAGQGNFSEAIAVSGDQPDSKQENAGALNWSAGYTRAKIPVGPNSDNSNLFDFSIGHREAWDFGAGYNFSNTPEEYLKYNGPRLWVGYLFPLGATGDEGFRPVIEPKFTFKTNGYKQSFSGTVTRVGSRRTITRPTSGTETIQQSMYMLSVEVSPIQAFTGTLSAMSYHYNKDVSRFLGLLDTPRAVSSGAASFFDTLGGFPKSALELNLAFYPWETWEFDLDLSHSKIQVDGSSANSQKIEALKDLGDHWKLGLGFDHETSDLYGQENLTVLDVAYLF